MLQYSIKFNLPTYGNTLVILKINVLVLPVFYHDCKINKTFPYFCHNTSVQNLAWNDASGVPPTSKVHIIPIVDGID
jgi:hypothetical protein